MTTNTPQEAPVGRRPLVLERRGQVDLTPSVGPVSMTPPVGQDYWSYRVRLSETQAVIGFPKFNTIGIGFAVEEDWNTNLPYHCSPLHIWLHIRHNKGDDEINDAEVITAIALIQDAADEDRRVQPDVKPLFQSTSREHYATWSRVAAGGESR